jgi:phytoene dehydrogenase-like protein
LEVAGKRKKVIVIGAGIAGLTTAAYLSGKGMKVTVFEKNGKPGGLVDTFARNGYAFEATTHQAVGFGRGSFFEPVIKRLGLGHLQPIESDHLFEVHYRGNAGDYDYRVPAGYRTIIDQLCEWFADDKPAIRSFMLTMKKLARQMYLLQRVIRLTNPFLHFFDTVFALMLMKTRRGSLLHRIGRWRYPWFSRFGDKSFAEMCPDFSPRLQSLLSQFWVYTGELPQNVSGILYSLIFYTFIKERPSMLRGGMVSLVNALVERIELKSGSVLCNSEVLAINGNGTSISSITLADGREEHADIYISAMSTEKLFSELYRGSPLPGEYLDHFKELKLSPGCFQVYIGLPYRIEQRGLRGPTHFFNFRDDLYYDRIPGDESPLIMTCYSAMDEEYAPPGCSSLVLFEIDDWSRWEGLDSAEYQMQKEECQALMLDKFKRATGIDLAADAEVLFSATSKTVRGYTGNVHGEAFGPASIVSQSMEKQTPFETPLENLFLTGTYSYSSPGISSSIDNGYVIAKQVYLKSLSMK